MAVARSGGSWSCVSYSSAVPEEAPSAAGGKILEIGVPLKALGVDGPDEVRFFAAIMEDGRELERFPSTGFLVVPVAPSGLNEQEWMV